MATKEIEDLKKEVRELRKMIETFTVEKKKEEYRSNEVDEMMKNMRADIDATKKMIREDFLTSVKEFILGEEGTAIKMDRQGMWVGTNKFAEAIAPQVALPNGSTSTAIAIDGTFYAKDGISGTFGTGLGGPSITVQNGIITNIA